jgi:hypothetical protein
MDGLFYAWLVMVSALTAATAVLLARCYLRSRAVERRIEREIDEIWGG